jgi:CBS domain containing-hemolysin-like protein
MAPQSKSGVHAARLRATFAAVTALLVSLPAQASFLSGDALAKAANVVAIIVICVVPIMVIVVFWLVHVLPEKIAHKNHHPQTKAIQVLCLLSLVFGGLLWPLAWLWAYTKPVLHKMAYGRDKADEYYENLATQDSEEADHLRQDIARLRADFERLIERGGAPEEFAGVRDRLAAIEPKLATRKGEAG